MDSSWRADKEQTGFQVQKFGFSGEKWLTICWDTSWTCNCSILLNLTLYPLPRLSHPIKNLKPNNKIKKPNQSPVETLMNF
jgi:hypothetical protein